MHLAELGRKKIEGFEPWWWPFPIAFRALYRGPRSTRGPVPVCLSAFNNPSAMPKVQWFGHPTCPAQEPKGQKESTKKSGSRPKKWGDFIKGSPGPIEKRVNVRNQKNVPRVDAGKALAGVRV